MAREPEIAIRSCATIRRQADFLCMFGILFPLCLATMLAAAKPAYDPLAVGKGDAHLKGDEAALKWLKGAGARKALASEDKWEMNGRAK